MSKADIKNNIEDIISSRINESLRLVIRYYGDMRFTKEEAKRYKDGIRKIQSAIISAVTRISYDSNRRRY